MPLDFRPSTRQITRRHSNALDLTEKVKESYNDGGDAKVFEALCAGPDEVKLVRNALRRAGTKTGIGLDTDIQRLETPDDEGNTHVVVFVARDKRTVTRRTPIPAPVVNPDPEDAADDPEPIDPEDDQDDENDQDDEKPESVNATPTKPVAAAKGLNFSGAKTPAGRRR